MSKKKYTELERYHYHLDRVYACGRYGLKFGGPKHSYSVGFSDGVSNIDNTGATRSEFGNRSGRAYAAGRKRGRAAAKTYLTKNGGQLRDMKRI